GDGSSQSIIDPAVVNASADAKDKHQNITNGEDDYTTQLFDSGDVSLPDYANQRSYPSLVTDYPAGGGIETGKDLKDYIRWTFGPDVVMLGDFDPDTATQPQWVIEPKTGYVYWSEALAPGQKTTDFLDSLTLTQVPNNVSLYYAIHTNLEAVDYNDIDAMDGRGGIPSKIIDAWKKVPGVKVPDTKPGTEFEFAGSQWRILDTDMNDNSSDGLQALVIKVESIGDSQFISDSNRTTYFSSAGTNGYEDSAAGGLKQIINAWYTTTIANNPTLEVVVQKVDLNNPSLAEFNATNNLSWTYDSGGWSDFYQDTDFATTLDASGRKQAFALSYGDIHGHMAVPEAENKTPLLYFSSNGNNSFWLRSAGSLSTTAAIAGGGGGRFDGNEYVIDYPIRVHPALSLLIQ
ncbi:hypothetical protein, partial [Pseudolactococcus yaeyamensis]